MGFDPSGLDGSLFWILFFVGIFGFLALDLVLFERLRDRRGIAWLLTGAWAVLALAFGLLVGVQLGEAHAIQFYTGILMEGALSVDNLLLMAVVLSNLGTNSRSFRRTLLLGLLAALFLRAGFVFAGFSLMGAATWLSALVGIALVGMGVRTVVARDSSECSEDTPSRTSGWAAKARAILRHARSSGSRWIPFVTTAVVILALEVVNSILSVDSVSALLVSSDRPFIVFASSAFGMIVLRSLTGCIGDLSRFAGRLRVAAGVIMALAGLHMTFQTLSGVFS